MSTNEKNKELREKIPQLKLGETVHMDNAGWRPNLRVCPHCQGIDFRALYDGTVFCTRCRVVVGRFAPKSDEPKEPKESKEGMTHCDKHKRFIPTCPDCEKARDETK